MPINCREVCEIANLTACSDGRLLEVWDQCSSGLIESDDEWLRAFLKECFDRNLSLEIDLRKGQLNFDVHDEDLRLINQKSLDPWVEPNCCREDFSYILGYAQSFAGYEFAEKAGIDLGIFANAHVNEYRSTGKWKGDSVELRCCLFYEIRRQRHIGLYEGNWLETLSLFKAVCAAYKSESSLRDQP